MALSEIRFRILNMLKHLRRQNTVVPREFRRKLGVGTVLEIKIIAAGEIGTMIGTVAE
jgi:hypothetical protein